MLPRSYKGISLPNYNLNRCNSNQAHCFIQFAQPVYTLSFVSGIQIIVDDPISFIGQEGHLNNV
jgi:hypothetical protein